MLRRRSLPLLVVLLTALQACTPGTGTSGGPSTAPDAASVNAAMQRVSTSREALDGSVTAVVLAVGRLPAIAQGLRSPSQVDQTLEGVGAVHATLSSVDPASMTAQVDALDAALVEAVGAVDATAAGLDPAAWEARYLAAQRDVLAALGSWSAANRSLVEALGDRWSEVRELADRARELDENRWRYRSPEEAAGTWEVETSGELDRLTTAATGFDSLVAARDQAAAAVTAADAQAAAVFEDRPATP